MPFSNTHVLAVQLQFKDKSYGPPAPHPLPTGSLTPISCVEILEPPVGPGTYSVEATVLVKTTHDLMLSLF